MGALRLRKIEIQGFRSFGSVRQTIDLPDTVTALWGGNSQGKTSFAEAMEFLITGQIARRELLASAKDEFSDSLRNAHIAPAIAVIVEAEFVCPDGKHRRLKRTLVEDYKGSSVCSSKVECE
jgi:recombinational DNA repair ATPase RecF